jgi:hypothetical protein
VSSARLNRPYAVRLTVGTETRTILVRAYSRREAVEAAWFKVIRDGADPSDLALVDVAGGAR